MIKEIKENKLLGKCIHNLTINYVNRMHRALVKYVKLILMMLCSQIQIIHNYIVFLIF